ncbi:hypothetical protein MTR67_043729 [Solanum verrucosum]|uniref:Uncharacterized protein n=1 Tax=Solanum verrucosum TaxID=315347 RepID=A0AAF0ZVE8_SOLVR|nr:hypothetical protein MTR67_043729 [Solanum verrucosum]
MTPGWSHNYTLKLVTNGKKNYRENHHTVGRPGSPQEKTRKDQQYQPKAQSGTNQHTRRTRKPSSQSDTSIKEIHQQKKTKDDLNEEQLEKVEENIVERFKREKERAKPHGTNNTTTHGK